jgi:tRNA pseudouridine38-40 synthase
MSSESLPPQEGFRYAALISYAGKRYCGWQRQKGSAAEGGPSIQASIEEALQRMTGEEPSVVGSGRTDSGVHAVGQCAHFTLRKKQWDPDILKRGLNSILKQDIQALRVVPVPMDFHAQRSALKKQYSYYFQQGPCAVPHLEPYSWWIKKKLDLEAMNEALSALRGEHDFKPFQASGAPPGRSTVRSVLEAETVIEPVRFPQPAPEGVHFVRVRLVGTGFLKQMVRGIAGTLLQVGEGRRSSDCIREILESGDRSAVGPTAPGRALWLERVWYPEHFGLG